MKTRLYHLPTLVALAFCLTATSHADTIYVSNWNGKIEKFDSNTGAYLGTFVNRGTGDQAWGLALDGAGNLYASLFYTYRIMKYMPNGVGSVFGTTWVLHPTDLAFDSAGNLYVAHNPGGAIEKFTPAGNRTIFATGADGHYGLAFDSAGNLFAATYNGTIEKFTPDGAFSVFASGLALVPEGLAFDSAGNLYSTSLFDNTIWKFTPDGSRSAFATNAVNNPKGMAFDSAGNLYVANDGNNTIVKFTPNGVGSVFASNLTGNGPVYNPQSIAITSIPEPSSWTMVCLAVSALLILHRRKA